MTVDHLVFDFEKLCTVYTHGIHELCKAVQHNPNLFLLNTFFSEIPEILHGEPFTDRKSTFQGHIAFPVTCVQQVSYEMY